MKRGFSRDQTHKVQTENTLITLINPFKPSGISSPYQLEESTSNCRVVNLLAGLYLRVHTKKNLISQLKHTLWVLKRTVSVRRFF